MSDVTTAEIVADLRRHLEDGQLYISIYALYIKDAADRLEELECKSKVAYEVESGK